MRYSMLKCAGILLVSTFVGAVSQVMLKKAAQRHYSTLWKEYLNPLVFLAYVLFVGTTILTILAYKGIPLSMGALLEATGYIYVMWFSVLFFGEKITKRKKYALCLIIVGICVYTFMG